MSCVCMNHLRHSSILCLWWRCAAVVICWRMCVSGASLERISRATYLDRSSQHSCTATARMCSTGTSSWTTFCLRAKARSKSATSGFPSWSWNLKSWCSSSAAHPLILRQKYLRIVATSAINQTFGRQASSSTRCCTGLCLSRRATCKNYISRLSNASLTTKKRQNKLHRRPYHCCKVSWREIQQSAWPPSRSWTTRGCSRSSKAKVSLALSHPRK